MNSQKYRIENNRILKKTDGKPIPDDEPVFILRGQDRLALAAMVGYSLVISDLEHKAEVVKAINLFREFRTNNPERMKEPDTIMGR